MISRPGNTHRLTDMFQTLEVSRSGYYDHTHKARRPRRRQDQAISPRLVEGFNDDLFEHGVLFPSCGWFDVGWDGGASCDFCPYD